MENIKDGKIDNSFNQFAFEHEGLKNIDKEHLKDGLYQLRQSLIASYGTNVKFEFLGANKTINSTANQVPNTTILNLLIKNDTHFSTVEFLYDDSSKKILNVNPNFTKYSNPSFVVYYILFVLGLLVVAFNIFVIVKIKKSTMKLKWLKYIAVIFLNFPMISYDLINGFDYKILHFQLLGFSFDSVGTYFSSLGICIPIAAIYWLWKIQKLKKDEEYNRFAEDLINN